MHHQWLHDPCRMGALWKGLLRSALGQHFAGAMGVLTLRRTFWVVIVEQGKLYPFVPVADSWLSGHMHLGLIRGSVMYSVPPPPQLMHPRKAYSLEISKRYNISLPTARHFSKIQPALEKSC